MRDLTVSFGTVNLATITAVKQLSWQAFAEWLTKEPPEHADKAARGWYIPKRESYQKRRLSAWSKSFLKRPLLTCVQKENPL